jgi:PAS domain S-box-containing protein
MKILGYPLAAILPAFVIIAIILMIVRKIRSCLSSSGKISKDNERKQKEAEISLFSEENLLDIVINSIPGIFFLYDEQGRIIRWNRKYQEYLASVLENISAIHILETIAVECREIARTKTEEVLREKRQIDVELLLLGRDRKKIPFYCTVSPIIAGEKTYLVGVGIDISQRKQAEDEQLQSEERLRLAAEATELGTWYLDLVSGSFRWSDRCYAIFGLPPGTPMNYDFFLTCLHPDDRERTHLAVMAALDPVDTREYDIEYRALWPADGSIHWISAKGRGYFEEVGGTFQATRMNGTTLDITTRVLAVEALRESEQKYRSLFVVEPDALILIDRETLRIMETNESALLLYGYSREDFLSLDFPAISADPEETRQMFLSSGSDLEYVAQRYHKKKNGQVFPAEISRCAFELYERKVIYFAIRDITERKLMERELEKAHKELEDRVRQRTAELTAVNLRLQQEIIEHKQTEEELQRYQQKLLSLSAELSLAEEKERRRIASELHDDIGQTLAMGQIKTESLMLSPQPADVSRSLTEIRDLIAHSIQKVRFLTSQLSPPLLYEVGFSAALRWLADKFQQESGVKIEILGDTIRKELSEEIGVTLFQVVRELVVNITKHARARNAQITVSNMQGKIWISVKDDGIGFDVSRIGKKDEFGLFNIRQKMKHLGGEIIIESPQGQGTYVSLVAPFRSRNEEIS